MDTNEALEELHELKYAIRKAEQDLRATVAEARVAGASWTEVGAQLGISKQAAQQQFSDYLPNTYRCNCGWSQIIPTTPERCRAASNVVLAHIRAEHPDATVISASAKVQTRTGPIEIGPEDYGPTSDEEPEA